MGKGQRTKGNTRPANSLRSAQLLSATLGSAPINTFIGFDALKEPSDASTIGSSNVGSIADEEEVDPDFKLIVKQMYKKDSITKIKALQKFAEYCNEKDYNSVKSVLLMWPRVFNKLAIDNDFRVRETTFHAQEALAKKLGKNIAPILKQIISIWVISLHDTYAVSASAAKSSFSASFPPNKQSEVLSFFKEEIINYCKDILLVQTIATIDDPSSVPAVDRESKYYRLISCSLQTLILLISSLSQPESIKDQIQKLINHDHFWRLLKFEDINVKVNWYRLKSVICEQYPPIIAANEAKFVSTTLLYIAEKDPLLSAAIWDNVLWILITIDGWWQHINLTKGFLPHLRKFIKEGGYGNATSIFPNFLPMLSKFPFDHTENPIKFVDDFIEAFEFCILNFNHSTKEYLSIVKSYFECIQYLLHDGKAKESLSKLESNVYDRIEVCIDQMLQKWNEIYSLYFSELTLFITTSKDPSLPTLIIPKIESKLTEVIEDAVNEENKLDMLTKLLSSLLRTNFDKTLRKVKFEEDDDEDHLIPEKKVKVAGIIYKDSLYKIWERLLELALIRETQTTWLNCLKQVQELCIFVFKTNEQTFDAQKYFDSLKELLEGQSKFTSTSTQSINYKHIINMILNCCDSQQEKSKIIFYLSSHHVAAVMINFFEILPSRIEKDPSLQEWFTTPEASPLFTSITSRILEGFENKVNQQISVSPCIDFITYAFRIDNVHFPSINSMISMLADSLDNTSTDNQCSQIVEIVKKLFDSYPLSAQLDESTSLIRKITMFCFDLNLTEETFTLYKSSLSSGLKVILEFKDDQEMTDLLKNLSLIIRDAIIDEYNSWEKSERLEMIAALMLSTVEKTLPEESTHLTKFSNCMIPEPDYLIEEIASMGLQVFYPLWIKGKVVVPPGLTFSSNQHCLNQTFICTIVSITKLLRIIPDSKQLTIKQLPFALFTLACLELVPQDFDMAHKELIYQNLTDYISHTIDQLTREEMICLFNKFTQFKPEGLIALSLGLRPTLQLTTKLNPVDSHWNLQEFDISSITIFQLLSPYFDPNEIINLSQKTLKLFITLEDPGQLHQCYGRLSVLNTCLNFDQINPPPNDLIGPLMDHLLAIKEKADEALLLECSLDNQTEEALLFTIEVMKIYRSIITKYHQSLNLEQKDLIIISVTAWSISLANSDPKSFKNATKMVLFSSYCNLFLSIQQAIEVEGDMFSSVREWTDFHLLRISDSLIPLLFHLNQFDFSGYQLDFISLLGKTISRLSVFDVAQLEIELQKFKLEEKEIVNLEEKAVLCPLPKEYESIFFKLNHLYVNKYSAFYLCAYHFAQRLIPMMVSSCSVFDSTFDYLAPPKPFLSKLQETDLIVDTLLSEYSLGTTCCLIKPGTDSFCYTVAYLLNWLQILTFFSQLSDENRSSLAMYLTDSGYIPNLLDNLFKLMPIAPDDQICDDVNFIQDVLTSNRLDSFDQNSHTQAISCLVYFHILRKMPACVRMWLSKLDKRTLETVNRFTTTTMSELICMEEFHAIQKADSEKFKNIKIKARHSAREVVAIYEIEDMSIELTIKLADNHPLTPVTIDGGRRVGVSVPEWRNWLLQVTSFLTHQNGTVLDGLVLWNRNMSKRFEGLEECVICYFILHGSNCQVPKLTCRNCKKKFHSACLYKWFEKSNQSSCPLCRNAFVFNKQQFGSSAGPSNQQQQQQQYHQQLEGFYQP